ncbi:ETX/MTX2 family pore-forming toxin [uncultured Desulfuromonas sp.]|uniref:ETX/MTX2 family pore-forming toxin n=1 Tax=uncultured Desulfuromonas sp. TaxID=181013 RepID=UPI002AABFC3F|nr:ETX/MTX2 family pore-forming toxin [uncultured Desulfuromonas sp.]
MMQGQLTTKDPRLTIFNRIKNGPAGGYKNPLEKLAASSVMFTYYISLQEYMTIEFGDITYNNVNDTTSKDSVDSLHWANHTGAVDEQKIDRSYQTTDSFLLRFTEGFKVGTTLKASVGLPLEVVDLGAEASISTELNFETQQSITVENKKTFTTSSTIKIPAHTAVKATVCVDKCRFHGSYQVKYKPMFTNAGWAQWNSELDWFKDNGHPEMEALRNKDIVEIFPDLDLEVAATGTIDGVAGYDINLVTNATPINE